ncbi:MAG TPA: prepilin-type N-terminal cleavage/methylation domain-containing protein [Longimicrobiales bacterium]|nr:prepilin-type N-terminal cleavage/methylation domain-containing protein [Longimicrobiales bacterium]
MVKPRPGFGLVEVIVALMLASVALLGVAGSAVLASLLVRQARADEQAAFEAMQVLDSLSQVVSAVSGQRDVGRFHLAWTISHAAGPATIDLAVQYSNGTRRRTLYFRALGRLP